MLNALLHGRPLRIAAGMILVLYYVVAMLGSQASAGSRDRDGDGMPNRWEVSHGLNPDKANARGDVDHDQLRNLAEFNNQTDPRSDDSDSDGVEDGDEVKEFGTDPRDEDDDDDGLEDGDEDDDNDGTANEDEDDSEEATDDSDLDGLDDEDENELGHDSQDADTDNDGVLDGDEDADGDGTDDADETDADGSMIDEDGDGEDDTNSVDEEDDAEETP